VGKVAADARRAREETEALKRKSDEYHRYVLESREKEKDITGWLEIYKEKAALAEAKSERLEREIASLRAARAPPPATAGGAGGPAVTTSAGRDAKVDQRVDNSTKVVNLNIYGRENMDPSQFKSLVETLLGALKQAGPSATEEAQRAIRGTMYAGGVRMLLGGEEENGVVRGWEENEDEVGVHVGEGTWDSRPTGEVAGYYGRRIGRTMEGMAAKGAAPAMGTEELTEWKKKLGSTAVRKAAIRNDIRDSVRKMKLLGRDEVDVLLGL
jgi:hypothetical protein